MVWRRRSIEVVLLVIVFFFNIDCKNPNKQISQGQVPVSMDNDTDGIPDAWESSGFEIEYPDGSKETLKSSPKQKDIYVFVAWMESATHTHEPDQDAINTVVSAFANAPTSNLDQSHGIHLHILKAHHPIPEQAMLGTWDNPQTYNWKSFDEIKASVFPHLTRTDGPPLAQIMHFCLFAHDYSSDHSSGITKTIPGRDFIVSLGGFTNQVGTPAMQAGTFMHELGHALGLRHGGNDDINYKPNYLSIMNYFFQLGGIPENGDSIYSYSSFQLDADEHHLSDIHALTSDATLAGYGSNFYCPSSEPSTAAYMTILSIYGPVDWKCDRLAKTEVEADVNNDQEVTPLPGRNDWVTLQLVLTGGTGAGILARTKQQVELTPAIASGIKLFPVGALSAQKHNREIVVAWKAKPLGQVLSYTVFRKTGKESKPVVIGRTGSSSFTDISPPDGEASYYVSAVYAPFSYPGSENVWFTRDTSPNHRIQQKVITSKKDLLSIERSSAELVSKFKSMGVTSIGASQTERPFPNVLLQTDLSQPAVVR
ncbi:MAG: hypothetical protein ABSD76_08555 [Terriglobales bacterium]|jgi:hypothetical protein